MFRGITNRYSNCYMSASIQLLFSSCMYSFLLPSKFSVFWVLKIYMLFIKYLLSQKMVLLLCNIVYKVIWQNNKFCQFESILIELSCSVRYGSIIGNSRKEIYLRVSLFPISQPTNLMSLLWDQYFCNLPTNVKIMMRWFCDSARHFHT